MSLETKIVGTADNFNKRFKDKLDTRTGCWQWLGKTSDTGYVRVRWFGERAYLHRLAYNIFVGTIPHDLCVDHICRNRSCCNPQHLRLVTTKENAENQSILRKTSSSGFRGVSWSEGRGKWATHLTFDGKSISLGRYPLYELHVAVYKVRQKRLEVFTHNEEDINGGW